MRTTLLISVLVIVAFSVAGQQTSTIHYDALRALRGMRSENWTEREKAFSQMPDLGKVLKQDPVAADRLKLGLIHLLSVENVDVQKGAVFTEQRSSYYGNLIGVVGDLNDERAIPPLLGAIATGGMATRALARFGDKALNPVLDQLKSPDPDIRSSALFTIRDLLEMHISIAPATQSRIGEVLRSSLEDPEFVVRESAITAIEYFDSREEFVPALERLAQSDSVKLPGKPDDNGDGGQFYPVRQAARRLLRKIANHEAPQIDKGVNH